MGNSHRPALRLVIPEPMHTQAYGLPSAWEESIRGWLSWLTLSGTRKTTLRLRRGHVRSIARRSRTKHPKELTRAQLQILCVEQNWSNDHRKGLKTSLTSFFDWCIDHDLADDNVAQCLPKVRGSNPRPRPATDQMWADLLATAGVRERMMARLAGEAGMRRAEVASCHHNDLMHDPMGWSLLVRGKGGRQRVVPITASLAEAIRGYCQHGYLFPGQIDGHISADYTGRLISKLLPAGFSMHKLRTRYATRGYAGTGNLRAVQEALGHASVATTQRYVAVSTRDVRLVSEAASSPPSDDVA